ncbi:MAG: hypothetical protein ACI9N9_000803 [Enterobacterales bacterium]|jgi:hypothetical protein
MTDENNQQATEKPAKALGPLAIMKSVGAAMIGVQSDNNRERDFEQGKASHFIIAGVIFVIIFLLTIATIVSSVLESSGQ